MELSAKNWPPQGHFKRLKMTPVGAFVTVSTPARSHSLTHSEGKGMLTVDDYGAIRRAHREIRCQFIILARKDEPAPDYALPLHQVGKLDSWEDFQDRQAMTLFTTRSTAGTTEPMSSAPRANGICSLAISPAPRHGTLSRSSATA